MKRLQFIAVFCALFCSFDALAQRPQSAVGCIDKGIRLQADEIKQHYTRQGFVVYRDAMLNMESMSPSPVMVEMRRGDLYQIIFVGTLEVQRMNMDIYDGNDNKILQRFMYKNRQQPNYLIVNFVPERTDTYLITLMQKLKNKDMCGSLCILRLDSDKPATRIEPYHE